MKLVTIKKSVEFNTQLVRYVQADKPAYINLNINLRFPTIIELKRIIRGMWFIFKNRKIIKELQNQLTNSPSQKEDLETLLIKDLDKERKQYWKHFKGNI